MRPLAFARAPFSAEFARGIGGNMPCFNTGCSGSLSHERAGRNELENDLFILVEMSTDVEGFGPSITTRIVEVNRRDGDMTIVKSEYDYLGSEPIEVELEEEDEGVYLFSFTSNDEGARTFVSEDAESSDYVEGDVVKNEDDVGQFIFRKITNIEWP
jgi:hypothetical protein